MSRGREAYVKACMSCSNLQDLDTIGERIAIQVFPTFLYLQETDKTLASKGKLPLISAENGLKKLWLGLLFLTLNQILFLDVSLVQPGFCGIILSFEYRGNNYIEMKAVFYYLFS